MVSFFQSVLRMGVPFLEKLVLGQGKTKGQQLKGKIVS